MGWLDSLKMRARGASPQARTALLAESAGRVFPVYEESWVGDYYPAVGRSIEIGWAYACGDKVDEGDLLTCLDHVQDLVSYYYEEQTRIGLLAATVTVVLRMLQSMTPDEESSCLAVARGINSAIHTAQCAEAQANQDIPVHARPEHARRGVAAAEENAWQEAALSLIDGWAGVATRNMFGALGGKPPRWLLDWRARSIP